MQINTNIAALNSTRHLSSTEGSLARSLQRLSSGLRINSARDDAAGLAISERLTTQIRGMGQAVRNANDGISMLQTAEGALGSAVSLLQRIRELAVQAANGTNSESDRAALQAEVAQSVAEVDRIGTTTSFNGQKLFAESDSSVMGDPNKLAVLDGLKSGWLQNSEELISQYFGIVGDGAGISIELSSFSDGAGGTAAQVVGSVGATGKATNVKLQVDMADFVPPNPPNGGTAPFYNDRIILHEMVHAVMYRSTNYGSLADVANDQKWFTEGVSEFIHGADERLAASIVAGGGTGTVMARAERFGSAAIDITNGTWGDGGTGQSISDDYSAGYAAVRYLHQKIKDAGGAGVKDVLTYMTQNLSVTLNTALANATHGAFTGEADFLTSFNTNGAAFIGAMNLSDTDTGAVGGANADGGSIKTAENVILDSGTYGDNALQYFAETWEIVPSSVVTTTKTLQIGANVGETLDIVSGAMNSGALDISTISLETDPSNAILRIDRALDYVNGERAKLGAQLNRLDSTLANLQTGVETTSASRSRTQDTDFAVETANLVRTQILQQAALSMTAQANALPQMALSLLRS